MTNTLQKYIPLVKVDEATHSAWGIATAEVPDKDNEVCDYNATVPQYKAWSAEAFQSTTGAGQEPSLGNIRLMHGLEIAGKATKIEFVDDKKQIWLESEPANNDIWDMLRRGLIRGYSQGGSYLWRKCNVCGAELGSSGNYCPSCQKEVQVRYAAKLAEVSYVDNPCLGPATFEYVKANGSVELRKFAEKPEKWGAVALTFVKSDGWTGEEVLATLKALEAPEYSVDHGANETYDSWVVFDGSLKGDLRGTIHYSLKLQKNKGIKFVIGFKSGGGSEVQSVIFDKDKWTTETAKQWLKDNDFSGTEVDETENSLRFRQHDPGNYERLRTITAGQKKEDKAATTEPAFDIHSASFVEVEAMGKISERLENRMNDSITKTLDDAAESIEARIGKSVKYLVTDSKGDKHLPYTDEDGTPNHRLMGAAWAALHGGYRGNKYEGEDKSGAISRLKEVYSKEGMDLPSEKVLKFINDKFATLDKGMYQVANLAQMLEQIKWLEQNCAYEAAFENDKDDEELVVDLHDWLKQGVKILTTMVEEETSELLAS